MKVVKAYPPNYPEVARAFGLKGKGGIIFSYGDKIFVPDLTAPLSAALLDHEYVHGERQLAYGVEAWWREYIANTVFRFDEELPAHRAEFAWYKKNDTWRGQERALVNIASRLSGRLYGNIVSFDQAKQAIKA